MIAADTSVLIDYLQQVDSAHTREIKVAIANENLYLPCAVITELYNSKTREDELWNILINEIPLLEIDEGYWDRAGKSRQKLFKHKFKARLGDTLIAQSCIDHEVPLLTRDEDYRHFAKYCGLKLVKS